MPSVTASPTRPRPSAGAPPRVPPLVKLRGTVTATLTLSFIILAAAVGLYFGFVPLILFVRPVNRTLYHTLMHAVVGLWTLVCLALPERVNGVRVRVSGTLPAPGSTLLLISNHKCDLDYIFVWAVAARLGMLEGGHFNAVAKGVLRRVPLFGWLFKAVGFLFLARSWEADRPRMAAWTAAALRHARPMWLLLYPEGTRYTMRAAEKSDTAAVAAGVPPLRCELLLPRTRGFSTLATALSPRFSAVMDCTIAYVGADGALMRWGQLGTSAITSLAAGTLPLSRVDVHVELFPFASLPQGDEALGAWLNDRWRRKEALLLHAQAHGEFPGAAPGVGEAPVPAGRTALACGLYAAGIALMAHLLRTSFAFRIYILVTSVAFALFANADPPEW